MSEINIHKPLRLVIDLIEVDEYLPSFKCKVDIVIDHPTGFFRYNANDLWIECSNWDIFNEGLINLISTEKFSIQDMSEQFIISIEPNGSSGYLFELTCGEPDIGQGISFLRFKKTVDSDELSQLMNSFRDFPKWW